MSTENMSSGVDDSGEIDESKMYTEYVEVQVDNAEAISKSEMQWGEPDTELLIEKYNKYLCMVGPMKRYKTKKLMWRQISIDIKNQLGVQRTDMQCENRYKTILKRKGQKYEQTPIVIKQPAVLRRKKQQKLFGKKQGLREYIQEEEFVLPEPEQGENISYFVVADEQELKQEDSRLKKKGRPVQETLILIHQIKEENRERRHQEKMEMLHKILNVLKK